MIFFQNLYILGSLEGEQKKIETDQKNVKKKIGRSLRPTKFFFGRPKKMRNRPNNWSTKRLTKSTWTPLEMPY